MPKKRSQPIDTNCPVDWAGLWGTPPIEGDDVDQQNLNGRASKRAKLYEYDSDSENEDLARQLVAKHHEEAAAQKKIDCMKLAELYGVEELTAWRAEMRHRSESQDSDGPGQAEQMELVDATQYERDMGCRIEPFHMNEERAVGHFDAEGFWIRDKPDEATDAWLQSLEEHKLPLAKVPVTASEQHPQPPINICAEYSTLLGLLQNGETVGAALWRLRGTGVRPKVIATAVEKCPDFQLLVDTADRLVQAGAYHLWDASHEELHNLAAAAETKEQEAQAKQQRQAKAEVLWELAWSKEEGAKLHGPFTADVMHAWKEQQYFSADTVAYARPMALDMFAMEEHAWVEAHVVDYFA